MKATAVLVMLLALALAPTVSAEPLHGSIYQVQGAPAPIFFIFSVSDQTFVAGILTFGQGGNGRWFAATGTTTDGVSGTGQIISPSGFALPLLPGGSFQFQLDEAGAAGSFTTTGLGPFVSPAIATSLTAGNVVRIFP